MSKPIVIGLAGFKRSGKSTVAQALSDSYGAYVVSPSDPINDFAERWLGKTEDNKDEPVDWLGGINMREILVTMGTEWGRNMVHPKLWILICKRRIEALAEDHKKSKVTPFPRGISESPIFVIPSIRFDNEAEMVIDEFGGKIIEVQRAGHEQGDHPSEHPVDRRYIAATIFNSGTLLDLNANAKYIVSTLFPYTGK